MKLAVFLALALALGVAPAAPVRIVFDTDIGNDIDDALALALLHSFADRGEVDLLAVTITKDNRWAAPYVDLVNTFYGRPQIPIGVVRNGVTPEDSKYLRGPAESGFYPHRLQDGTQAEDAVKLLQRVLAAQPDGSVVIVQVGFSTNLARLLAAPGGRELAAKKVRLAVLMAGWFPQGDAEYNVKMDLASARKVFAEWPSPLVTSGFEIGRQVKFPARDIETHFSWTAHHPVADAYRLYMRMPYDRETWDLTSVLYAVRPDDGYFGLSPAGEITVDEKGITHFVARAGGTRRYLTLDTTQVARVLEAFRWLASAPPRH